MAKNDNLKDFVTDVADAIREKKGTTDLINPQDFSAEIKSIESNGGGSGESGDWVYFSVPDDEYSKVALTQFGVIVGKTKLVLQGVTSIGSGGGCGAYPYVIAIGINKKEYVHVSLDGGESIMNTAEEVYNAIQEWNYPEITEAEFYDLTV